MSSGQYEAMHGSYFESKRKKNIYTPPKINLLEKIKRWVYKKINYNGTI